MNETQFVNVHRCILRSGKSKALLQLHWRVKRNPVKNVDNLFPTTKGKNIVCLFKKNVTTWQLENFFNP